MLAPTSSSSPSQGEKVTEKPQLSPKLKVLLYKMLEKKNNWIGNESISVAKTDIIVGDSYGSFVGSIDEYFFVLYKGTVYLIKALTQEIYRSDYKAGMILGPQEISDRETVQRCFKAKTYLEETEKDTLLSEIEKILPDSFLNQ